MKLHPRHVPCEMARRKLSECMADLAENYNLTAAEQIQLLAERVSNMLAWEVRHEREDPEET